MGLLRKNSAVVQIRCEIVDVKLWQNGLEPSKYELFWRHLALADLIVQDETPHETEYELYIAVDDIRRTDVDQTHAVISDGVESQRDALERMMAIFHRSSSGPDVLFLLLLLLSGFVAILQRVDKFDEAHAVRQVSAQLGYVLAIAFELFVNPIGECVLLYLDPFVRVYVASGVTTAATYTRNVCGR